MAATLFPFIDISQRLLVDGRSFLVGRIINIILSRLQFKRHVIALLYGFLQHDMVEQRLHAVVALFPRMLGNKKIDSALFEAFHIPSHHVVAKQMEIFQAVMLKVFSQNVCAGTERDAMPDVRLFIF